MGPGVYEQQEFAVSLTCFCSDGDYDWWHYPPEDYSTLSTKRGRRCCSCKAWIKPGATVGRFERWRNPTSDVEIRIYADEVPLPDKFMCEPCLDQYFNLTELGFCIDDIGGESMDSLRREYIEVYGGARKSAGYLE